MIRKTKRVAAAILCGIMVMGLTACGASSQAMDSMENSTTAYAPKVESAWADSVVYSSNSGMSNGVSMKDSIMVEEEMAAESKVTLESGQEAIASAVPRKVIRTATLNLQTLDFDVFSAALEEKMAAAGAYLQYANVSGNKDSGRRSADYTIRVPESSLDAFLTGIEGIATVTNKTLGEQDVTLDYVDMESHVKTLEIEQERLLALLEKAENLDSIIKLEERLSEVRYRIESYQSKLRTYDDRIAYSTVHIYIYEVTRVAEKAPATLWERIRNGWKNTMYDITDGAEDFVVWFVVNLPYLVFWAAVIVVLVVVFKKKRAKRKAKKLEKQREKNETELDGKE